IVLAGGHERVDVRPVVSGGTGKTVRSTDVFSQSPWAFQSYSFAAHYERPGQYALLSGQASGGAIQVGFTNTCVDLYTRTTAPTGSCDNFDTQDMAFLSQPTGIESDFPNDFSFDPPAAPSTGNTATPQ